MKSKLFFIVIVLSAAVPSGISVAQSCGMGPRQCFGDLDMAFVLDESEGYIHVIDSKGNVVNTTLRADSVAGTGDWNNDGQIEIIYLLNYELYSGTVDGNHYKITGGRGYIASVGGIADYDGDGDPGIPYTNYNKQLWIYENSGSRKITSGIRTIGGSGFFDSDRKLDISYHSLYVNENPEIGYVETGGNSAKTILHNPTYQPIYAGSIGDYDGDGISGISFVEGSSIKVFEEGTVNSVASGDQLSLSRSSLDFDKDGADELAYHEKYSGSIKIENLNGIYKKVDYGSSKKIGSIGGINNIDADYGSSSKQAGTSCGLGPKTCSGELAGAFVESGTNKLMLVDQDGQTEYLGVEASKVGGIADFDSDGDQDVAYSSKGENRLMFVDLKGNTIHTDITGVKSLGGIADFNGDGYLDIAFSSAETGGLTYYDTKGEINTVGSVGSALVGGFGDYTNSGQLNLIYSNNINELMRKEANQRPNVIDSYIASDVGGLADKDSDGWLNVVFEKDNDHKAGLYQGLHDSSSYNIRVSAIGGFADVSRDSDKDFIFVDRSSNLKFFDLGTKESTDTGQNAISVGGLFRYNMNNPPKKPASPNPDDNSQTKLYPNVSAKFSDPDGDSGTLTYYLANDTEIGSCSVSDGARCEVNNTWASISGTTYEWYAVASDDSGSTKSNIWSFTTDPAPYASNPAPADGETGLELEPDVSADYNDPDGDTGSIAFYMSNGSYIGGCASMSSGSKCTRNFGYASKYSRTYEWYAVTDDGTTQVRTPESGYWSFETKSYGAVAPETGRLDVWFEGHYTVFTVTKGDSITVPVKVSNPENERTIKLEIVKGADFSSFADGTDLKTFKLSRDTKNFVVKTQPDSVGLKKLKLKATNQELSISKTAEAALNVQPGVTQGGSTESPNEVPGIGILNVLFIAAASSAYFLF